MIYIYTGSNGTGKTASAIYFIETRLNPDHSRPVYYLESPNQKLDIEEIGILDWEKISVEDAKDWRSFDPNSIFLIDECRHLFPWRKHTVDQPEFVDKLSEHRGEGMDFVLTAQKTSGQFDPAIQGFIEEHRHMATRTGSKRIKVIVCQQYQTTPTKPDQLVDWHIEKPRIPQKYFDAYKSAKVHTHIDRTPYKKLIPIAGLILLIIVLGLFAYSRITAMRGDDPSNDIEPASLQADTNNAFGFSDRPRIVESTYISDEEYFALRKPRVINFPHTAPLYDAITEPVDYPRISCAEIITPDRSVCLCNTQQFTRVNVSQQACSNIAQNGWFDPAKHPEPQYRDWEQGTSTQNNNSYASAGGRERTGE